MIKTNIAVALAAFALTGCMTAAEKQAEADSLTRLEAQLAIARQAAAVPCPDTPTCDRAWMLTKNYVEQNSEMRVRRSDDASIETFLPINSGMVAFHAKRVPLKGGGMVITLAGICKNMYSSDGQPAANYAQCATKIGIPQKKFRGYLEENL
jgi:hypothetical protein